MHRPIVLALLAQLGWGGAADGQSRSVLSLLPVEDQVLEIGGQGTGTLSASDYLSAGDSYLDAWELTGPIGASVTVDLASDDFDAYLYVTGPGLGETLVDDDSGGGCNARVRFTLLEAGSYRIIASTISTRSTGSYRISVSDDPPPPLDYACGDPDPSELRALPTNGRELMMGSVAGGSFDYLATSIGGRPVEAWTLRVIEGEPLVVVQRSSDFDSYLWVLGPDIPGTLGDDDGGGDLDSRIELTPGTAGPYTVIASALGESAQGGYTLHVEQPADLATLPVTGALPVGQTGTGLLGTDDPLIADGRRGQVWALEGAAGARVTIELVSDAFDAFLYVAGPGLPEPLTDDDGAGDLDSSITLTFPATGSYRVIATSLDGSSTGPYTLRVTAR